MKSLSPKLLAVMLLAALASALAPAMRGRFEKMATAGEFDLGDLELLSLAALAAQEARESADRALAKGGGRVPLALIKDLCSITLEPGSQLELSGAALSAAGPSSILRAAATRR